MKKGRPFVQGKKWRIRHTKADGTRISRVFDSFEEADIELRSLELERDRESLGQSPPDPRTPPRPLNPMPDTDQPIIKNEPVTRAEISDFKSELKSLLGAPKFPDKTFNELCDIWHLRNVAEKKRSHADDESIIRAHLRPFFGSLFIREIDNERVNAFKVSRGHLSVKTVSNHLTLLITMLNYAASIKWGISKCPEIKKPKVVLLDSDFSYFKDESEVARFLLSAKDEVDEMPYYLYATAIYTGLRAGELAGLNRADVDLKNNRITVSRSYDGKTKNGETRHVPILDILRPVLVEWLSIKRSPEILFCNRFGGMLGESGRVFQEVFKRVLKRANFPDRYLTFHDLRHTFASHWVLNEGDIFKLQKILGHKSLQMTMRYAHLAPNAFQSDLARFGKSAPGLKDSDIIRLPVLKTPHS